MSIAEIIIIVLVVVGIGMMIYGITQMDDEFHE